MAPSTYPSHGLLATNLQMGCTYEVIYAEFKLSQDSVVIYFTSTLLIVQASKQNLKADMNN
jgi:hypothetical protein